MAASLAGFLQVGSDCRPKQVRHIPYLDVAHLFSGAVEDSLGIRQFTSPKEAEIDVILHDTDVANTVLHSVGRAVMEGNDVDLEDVLAAGRHFFEHQLAQPKGKFLDSPGVRLE